jgi:hypothetical protein
VPIAGETEFWFCIQAAGGIADVAMQGSDAEMQRTGMLNIDGTEGVITRTSFGPNGSDFGPGQLNRPARIHSVSDDEIVIDVEQRRDGEPGWIRFTVLASTSGCTTPPEFYQGCHD